MTVKVNPLGLVGNDSDISCCWFALGYLWNSIGEFDPEDTITIHAPDELLRIKPRGQGDVCNDVLEGLGINEIYLAHHIVGRMKLTGVKPGRNPVVRNGENFQIGGRDVDFRLGVSLIAISGLEDRWVKPSLPISLGGQYAAQEFLDVILKERKWWENTLPFS